MTGGRGRRFWWGAGAVVAVLIVLVGWFTAISPQLSAASTAQTDAQDLQRQNQALRASIATLEQQQPDPLRASLRAAVAALPYDSDLPALTRQFTQQAAQNHVTPDSIVVGSTSPAGGAAAPAGTSAGTSAGATGTLLAIPITLTSTGLGADQRAFLKEMQVQGPRRVLVTAIQLAPVAGDGSISGLSTMTTTLTAFVAPLTGATETQLDKLISGDSSS